MADMKKISIEERKDAMLSHILGIFIGILSPLIFLRDGKKGFSQDNYMDLLKFKLSMIVYQVCIFFVFFFILIPLLYLKDKRILIGLGITYLIILLSVWIFQMVCGTIASIKSYNSVLYKYPLKLNSFSLKWNPFMILPTAIQSSKKLLFPFNLRYWLKLGFVSLLSTYGQGTAIRFNYNFSGSSDLNKGLSGNETAITGKVISNFSNFNIITGFIALGIFMFSIFMLIWNYLTSIFTFIFIDVLANKNYTIKESMRKNSYKGMSLFFFKVIMFFVFLIIVSSTVGIFLIKILRKFTFKEYFDIFGMWNILLQVLPYLLIMFILLFILGIFMSFFMDITLPYMYQKSVTVTEAIKQTLKRVRKMPLMVYLYFLTKEIINFIYSFATLILGLFYIILMIIVGLIGSLILFLLLFFISKTFAIIIVVLFWIALITLGIYLFIVLILPLTVFKSYYCLHSYEKFFDEKIVKINGSSPILGKSP
jgi:uncharacterized Tic20 family protein